MAAISSAAAAIDQPPMNDNWGALRRRFRRDGYLILNRLLPAEEILAARSDILRSDVFAGYLRTTRHGLSPEAGILRQPGCSPSLLHSQHLLGRLPSVTGVLENPRFAEVLRRVFGWSDPVCLPYKWLRAVPRDQFTGPHIDRSYFHSAPRTVATFWIPLGRVTPENGALRVLPGSHRSGAAGDQYFRPAGSDGTRSAWLNAAEAAGAEDSWITQTFEPGDAVLLDWNVLHATLVNRLAAVRISCDVRWLDGEQHWPRRRRRGEFNRSPDVETEGAQESAGDDRNKIHTKGFLQGHPERE